jgi:aminoglycoside phosphotransferase (APT) family kinase protein
MGVCSVVRRRGSEVKSQAWRVLGEYLEALGVDPRERIGRLTFVGEGASYRVYHAWCRLPDSPNGEETPIIVKTPRKNPPPEVAEEAMREKLLLDHLASLELPLRLPRTLATIPSRNSLAVVQTYVPGLELVMRVTRVSPEPWRTIAMVASVCHGLDVAPVVDILPGPETRRECAYDYICGIDDLDGAEASAFRHWTRDHLPPDTPARMLHGDLHGRNVLVPVEPGDPLGLVDWAFAEIGCPALELAIVTDGSRRPFARTDGMARLLEAYNGQVDETVHAHEVYLFEAAMALRDYADALEFSGLGSVHAENERRHVVNLLKRAGAL